MKIPLCNSSLKFSVRTVCSSKLSELKISKQNFQHEVQNGIFNPKSRIEENHFSEESLQNRSVTSGKGLALRVTYFGTGVLVLMFRIFGRTFGSLVAVQLLLRPCGRASTMSRATKGAPWPSGEFRGFSWHTVDPSKVVEASARLNAAREKKGKTAVVWEGMRGLPDGFYLPWKRPVTFAAGYMWFDRVLGDMVGEPGQTSNWHVEGHHEGFDPKGLDPKGLDPKRTDEGRREGMTPGRPAEVAARTKRRRLRSKTPAAPKDAVAAVTTNASAILAADASATAADASATAAHIACPMLLFGESREVLERRHTAYALARQLGQGTYGSCFLGTRLADGKAVAVKALRKDLSEARDAFVEAHVLDRCRDHPHIPSLLDVFIHRDEYHLVMEYAGDDLDKVIRASAPAVPPCDVRNITRHVALALAYLHGAGMIHADLKPHNIFVSTTPGGQASAMLGDVGQVLEADPRARVPSSDNVQTLWWRAPEVLFGSRGFDQAIDIWSLGLVVAELGGCRFQDRLQEVVASEVGYAFALFQQLGTPDTPALTGLPLWLQQAPQFRRRPWPREVVLRLGAPGLDLLEAMLSWAPTQRPTAHAVQEHAFQAPERFCLIPQPGGRRGEPSFQGRRHPWNICAGTLAVEVLEWLRADDSLRPGSPQFEALAVDFFAARRDAKSEEGRKFILAGAVDKTCGSGKMCGLSLAHVLPLSRLRAWRAAFMAINAEALARVQALARDGVRRLSPADRGRNGDDFLEMDLSEWFASCGELAIAKPGSQEDGFWAEPEHKDGGASVLHLGLTLYGRRALACRRDLGLPDVIVPNAPGTVYLGQLTGPVHQVSHQEAHESELLEVPGHGRVAVSIMLRTALFPFGRARLRNTTPSPRACFEALARCFREGLAAETLRLPGLSDCQAHMETS